MTFERRSAAQYLALLLTGATATEVAGRRIERVAFQQAPTIAVDDIVITAARDDEEADLELAIAVRRAPAFTTSDGDTEKLLGDFIEALYSEAPPGVERRFAICVAGAQTAAQQVQELAVLARGQHTAPGFFSLVRTSRRFRRPLVTRLDHLVNLVTANLKTTGRDNSAAEAERLTWRLLVQLDVVMPRLEAPDESDWIDLVNKLEPWARDHTLAAGTALRDRLEALAARYSPQAAVIDLRTLRRDVHDTVNLERRRNAHAWTELRRLDADARAAVRTSIGVSGTGATLQLPRDEAAAALREQLAVGACILITGESGVGKSALVIRELSAVVAADPANHEVICLNLRQLPSTMAEVRAALGAPLEQLLAEMSAPDRLLVIDGADAVVEADDHLLAQLISAALTAGVTPWIVTATEGLAAVRSVVEAAAQDFVEHLVMPLTDDDLSHIAGAFPALRRLVDEPRAKELLRRPMVVDLFVRAGNTGLPLSDADALDVVWAKLVRDDGRNRRGTPDARDQVFRRLAAQQLKPVDASLVYADLDAAALDGLRRNGLLRPAAARWQVLPDFAHELLRTYATAQVLLASHDPVGALIQCGAPRWALPAARLAAQVMLAATDKPHQPVAGRFASVQANFDRLPEAGYGDRWADLPSEAVVSLPEAADLLAAGWSSILRTDGLGLRRLLRVTKQRYGRTGLIDALVAEPLVGLLLDHGWPDNLNDQVDELFRCWLSSLVVAGEPAGNMLRVALRDHLAAIVTAGDQRLVELAQEQAARLASRTSEQIREDAERKEKLRGLTSFSVGGSRRRRHTAQLPGELINDAMLAKLALLGADLGADGERLLRRVGAEAPQRLAAAVEEPFAGHGLVAYRPSLVTELAEAYYLDEDDDEDSYHGLGDWGIRNHHLRGPVAPLAAHYRGPFLAMFRSDFTNGVACLNRLLNHAAKVRVKTLAGRPWRQRDPDDDRYRADLAITGERRRYIGDGHVWQWYRGTGVGPYPCMSALQALEVVCDEFIGLGAAPTRLVPILLQGCENLAMPALVVGLLVRHLEQAGRALDPFLAEPEVWHLEFSRFVNEHSMLASKAAQVHAADRRRWTFREAAASLVLSADDDRIDELRVVGRRLVARARELEVENRTDEIVDDEPMSEELATVRGWAASLDRDAYKFTKSDGGYLVEQMVDDAVTARLAPTNKDLQRGNEATRILFRYPERYDQTPGKPDIDFNELVADIRVARDLLQNPPIAGPGGAVDAPAAVAAAAIEARYVEGMPVPDADILWAASTLITLVNQLAEQGISDYEYAVFGRSADRAAARAIPLIGLPAAKELRSRLNDAGVDDEAIHNATQWLVTDTSNETRLFLARTLDPAWRTRCDSETAHCHHSRALDLAEDIARDCIIGPWDAERQERTRVQIVGPLDRALDDAQHDTIDVPRLSATIRAVSAAAASSACCKGRAAALLRAALAAHRRGMHTIEHGYHHSDNDALTAARAVLDIAAAGDDLFLTTHIDNLADDGRLLAECLRAVAAAGEETTARAEAARRLWPSIIDQILDLVEAGRRPNARHHYEWAHIAALMPTPSYEHGYLHREFVGERIRWVDVIALTPQINRWISVAAGSSETVDALVHLLYGLSLEQQAEVGLPWVEALVMVDPDAIAARTYLLSEWLEAVRQHARTPDLLMSWHRLVDGLTVAGDQRIAALAD